MQNEACVSQERIFWRHQWISASVPLEETGKLPGINSDVKSLYTNMGPIGLMESISLENTVDVH